MAKRSHHHVYNEAFGGVPKDLGDVVKTLLHEHFHLQVTEPLFSAVVGILQTRGYDDPTMGLVAPLERYNVRYAPSFFDAVVAALGDYGNNQGIYDAVFQQLKHLGKTTTDDTTPSKAAAK